MHHDNPDAEDDLGYSVPVSDYRQGDLFEADLKWTWILNSIFSSGAAARMGSSATIVLFCLRCSGNYQNGLVSLGQREIAKQTGLSRSSVARALSTLEEEKFIKKEKVSHKRIVYSLDDAVPFFDPRDEIKKPVGEMRVPFVPLRRDKNLNDARRFLADGKIPPRSPIHIHYTKIENKAHAEEGGVAIAYVNNAGENQVVEEKQITPEYLELLVRIANRVEETGTQDDLTKAINTFTSVRQELQPVKDLPEGEEPQGTE